MKNEYTYCRLPNTKKNTEKIREFLSKRYPEVLKMTPKEVLRFNRELKYEENPMAAERAEESRALHDARRMARKISDGELREFFAERDAGESWQETRGAMRELVAPKPTAITLARVRADLTQAECARLMGVPIRTWQRWEYGESSMRGALWQFFLDRVKKRT